MAKLLNILALVYLGIAPGMNVDNLLHSVSLCHFVETATLARPAHDCESHDHGPDDHTPTGRDEPCDHIHRLSPDSGAMPASSVIAHSNLAVPLLPSIPGVGNQLHHLPAPTPEVRPPPGNLLTGITLLLI